MAGYAMAISQRYSQLASCILALAAALVAESARAACPIGSKIDIDHDLPGSGYSETGGNWTSWSWPCNGPGYRYLSHTVGDGSRKGKAIWKPAIKVAGTYRVRTAYRATENRTKDADYYVYDDKGASKHHVENQFGNACKWVDLGTFYCKPGGSCRVVLDGTDDSHSDCADRTRYELISCGTSSGTGGTTGSGGTSATGCGGISKNPSFELCSSTATTCAGVYTNGGGCQAFCAAAGMTCKARFGGEPGCQKEPHNPIPCSADNTHQSDWCECVAPPASGGTGGGGVKGGGGSSASSGAGTSGSGASAGTAGDEGNPAQGGQGGVANAGSSGVWGGGGQAPIGAVGGDGGHSIHPPAGAEEPFEGEVSCRAATPAGNTPMGPAWLVALSAGLLGMRRKVRQTLGAMHRGRLGRIV